jgi:hypothetical protein
MEQKNELVKFIDDSNLMPSKIETLMSSFTGYFNEAKKLVSDYKSILVTDIEQKDEMKKAREARLELRGIRINCENTRKELKEQSLREGKAIDGISNIIKALIVPVEEYLEKQEKFSENIEKERIEKQFVERVEKLSKYVSDVSLYNIKDMADEVFENLLYGCKTSWEKAQQEQKEAEEKRIKDEQQQKIFNERRIELAPYDEFRLNDVSMTISLDTTEEEYKIILKNCQEIKKNKDDEQKKIIEQNKILQDKIDADRIEKEKQDKIKADEQLKIAADKKAQEEMEKKKLLAPDKEKLLELADIIDKIQIPNVASDSAGSVVKETKEVLNHLTNSIREKAKQL